MKPVLTKEAYNKLMAQVFKSTSKNNKIVKRVHKDGRVYGLDKDGNCIMSMSEETFKSLETNDTKIS